MKRSMMGLTLSLLLPIQTVQAAFQTFPIKAQQVIYEDGRKRIETARPLYGFRVELISDDTGVMAETFKTGRPFVTAKPDERYAVRLYNPLPVQVAVNLTIDGLNSLTGKPSGISDGTKWVIEPYSFITLRGWQVNGEESRRFFFTEKPKTYATWRGDQMGKDLSANCGVIGAAYFWSQSELDAYYEAHPQYRYTATRAASPEAIAMGQLSEGAPSAGATLGSRMSLANAKSEPVLQKAGTGMGERESHPTQRVEFNYDQGMYRLSQAIVIYYDFDRTPQPNPFPAISFAPEMP